MRLPPTAPDIARSIRGLGYTPPTAVADLVDNSISAGANQILIDFEWQGATPYVEIVDNGRGMDRDQLIAAMRLGADPRAPRPEGDLGRFGLGLKTASLSQATVLTVISKVPETGPTAVRWDLARIEAAGDWDLWTGSPLELGISTEKLDMLRSGTIVRWDHIDRLLGPDGDIDTFFAIAEAVSRHLGMIFHRMISSGMIEVRLNGVAVTPWDPVSADYSIPIDEERFGAEDKSVCKSYVLKHAKDLTEEQHRRAGGPKGWLQQQGFYIYREHRLVAFGGWLDLGQLDRPWRLEPRYNLARLTIDLNNADDDDWGIDLKKSQAAPPEATRSLLYRIAQKIRKRAVSRSRNVALEESVASGIISYPPIWLPRPLPTTAPFRVNRRHPLVVTVRKALSDAAPLRALLNHLERTAPLSPVSSPVTPDIVAAAARELREADIRRLLLTVYPNYRRILQLSPNEACEKLLDSPHFLEHRALVLATVEVIERDMLGAT